MSGFCTFDFHHPAAPGTRRRRHGVIFSSMEDLNHDILADRVHTFLQSNPPTDELIILTHEFSRSALIGLTANPVFLRRLPGRFLAQDTLPVTPAYFKQDGVIYQMNHDADIPLGALGEAMVCGGLWSVFDRRRGLLPSSPVHHFVKPSGKHIAQFIRTAQILVDGGEVDFIASSILSYLRPSTAYIYCDTASISVLAYAVVKLRKCHDSRFICPTIISFGSYTHVDEHRFLNPSDSLFLISASTSGDLAHKLVTKKGVPSERIVTLFYLGEASTDSRLLLNLTSPENPERRAYPRLEGFKSEDCPYCRQGSSQVVLLGDQFLPQSPNVEALLLETADAPRWLSSFMKKCVEKGIIRCHHGKGLRGRVHEIFLHVSPAFRGSWRRRSSAFGDSIRKIVDQGVPASLTWIIHIDDDISRDLARFIKARFVRRHPKAKLDVLNVQKIYRDPEAFRTQAGTVLVVAGCFVTGRSLMELSQVLRSIQENGAIVFFIGVARSETEEIFKEIRTNVTYTRDRSRSFGFQCVERIYIPDSTSFRESIWTEEERFLKTLRSKFAGERGFPSEIIDRRIALLEGSAFAGKGLQTELFWPDSNGSPMELRQNFAYFDFEYDARAITQAEVFFVMASILHNLRCERRKGRSLLQFEHDRRLIAPNSFYRLNDGVIQAALLRAAHKAEIDYRVREVESAEMAEVVNSIFSAWNRPRGEAAIEFLLMLAMRQLRLADADVESLVKSFGKKVRRRTFEFYLIQDILSKQ